VPRQQPVRAPQNGRTYRGRRRLPKLPSKRYAAVVTTAFVGAGVVALTAGAVVPNSGLHKVSDEATAQSMSVEDRLNAVDKANRSENRAGPAVNVDQSAPDVWLLPLSYKYQITTLFEMRWGTMHFGVDLAAPEGTPYYATHAGTVILARVNGGYGNCVEIDNGNGIITIYGHAVELVVHEGQKVKAGDQLGFVGTTGYSTGPHLHYEIKVNEGEVDPIRFMLQHGVDIPHYLETARGDIVVN
jgi:murein DD-endopeptidase MepM/ murein hydrolase activator NlpD